jgi:hypothetical protein
VHGVVGEIGAGDEEMVGVGHRDFGVERALFAREPTGRDFIVDMIP